MQNTSIIRFWGFSIMNDELLRHQIKLYGEELKEILNPENETDQRLVQRGLLLFRQQLVYQIRYLDDRVAAKVQDVTPVDVELVFDSPETNVCSCPDQHVCRHQLALFFAVLSKVQSIFLWTQEWKEKSQLNHLLSTLKRGSDLLKQPEEETKGPEGWIRQIQDMYRNLPAGNYYQLEEWARSCYWRLLGFGPMEREWKPLFKLFASCESMRMASSHAAGQPGPAIRELKPFTQYMLAEAGDALDSLSRTASPFAFDEYFSFLNTYSHEFLEQETVYPAEFTEIYRKLWTTLFKRKHDRQKELSRLQKMDAAVMDGRHKVAIIHLAILLGEDRLAIEEIKQYGPEISPFALLWIKMLQAEGSKQRLSDYLPVLLNQSADFISSMDRNYEQASFARSLFHVLDEDLLSQLDAGMLEKMYITLLPHSRYHYSEYLLEKQEFRKWTELQAYSGSSLDYVDRHTIDLVARHDPGALFPLYHEAISDLIHNRNRDSYKRAVRLLKRLQKLYKKEKKLPQWDVFLNQLLGNTKRLRAFHEECRKGKLIDAES